MHSQYKEISLVICIFRNNKQFSTSFNDAICRFYYLEKSIFDACLGYDCLKT